MSDTLARLKLALGPALVEADAPAPRRRRDFAPFTLISPRRWRRLLFALDEVEAEIACAVWAWEQQRRRERPERRAAA